MAGLLRVHTRSKVVAAWVEPVLQGPGLDQLRASRGYASFLPTMQTTKRKAEDSRKLELRDTICITVNHLSRRMCFADSQALCQPWRNVSNGY